MKQTKSLEEQIGLLLKKAKRSLRAAERLMNEGDNDFASSRAYYSVFYALEATILTKNLSFSKHSGVISAFSQYFIKTGIFPLEFSKYINQLFRERHAADYDFEDNISTDEVKSDIEVAGIIIDQISNYFSNQEILKF